MPTCTCASPTAVSQAISSQSSALGARLSTLNVNVIEMHKTMYGIGMRPVPGMPGAPAPVRFGHWAAPEYGTLGETAWAKAFEAAAIAIGLANSIAQGQIAEKQQDLADGYYQMAKYKWDRFSGKYMPLEKKLLNEVSTAPISKLNCADADIRAQNAVNTAYDGMRSYMARQAKKLRLCVDPSLVSMLDHNQSVAFVDTENYNTIDGQWYVDYKNDDRWNKRNIVLNLGRNLSTEALKYGQVAQQAYGQVGAQIERAAQGVVTAMGYFGARNDTVYPTTYLNGGTLVSMNNPVGSSLGANYGV